MPEGCNEVVDRESDEWGARGSLRSGHARRFRAPGGDVVEDRPAMTAAFAGVFAFFVLSMVVIGFLAIRWGVRRDRAARAHQAAYDGFTHRVGPGSTTQHERAAGERRSAGQQQ
jgi:hypothetical protein